jgi:hypothetical protein
LFILLYFYYIFLGGGAFLLLLRLLPLMLLLLLLLRLLLLLLLLLLLRLPLAAGMCVQLQRLELRRCGVDGVGAQCLARGVEAAGCPLSALCLDGNSLGGDEGALPLGNALAARTRTIRHTILLKKTNRRRHSPLPLSFSLLHTHCFSLTVSLSLSLSLSLRLESYKRVPQ